MPPAAREVLDYWLGPDPDDARSADARRELWYRGGPAADAEIGRRFGDLVDRALAGEPELLAWGAVPAGAAALVILLDQFTRNLFRRTSRAWAGDPRAMQVASRTVAAGADVVLPVAARIFLYHPYHHSERPVEQDEGVRLFERLECEAGAAWSPYFARTLPFVRGHRDIVTRFGRFPHRNTALGRASTPEERAFLAEHPEAYGQGGASPSAS